MITHFVFLIVTESLALPRFRGILFDIIREYWIGVFGHFWGRGKKGIVRVG